MKTALILPQTAAPQDLATMAGAITIEQACKLEQAQDQASCNALNRRAAGGAA